MIEIIKAIAALCLIPNGGDSWAVAAGYIHSNQLACQQYYIQCVSSKGKEEDLWRCILNKPLDRVNLNRGLRE